ncbi:putative phage head-tail adaptor [Hoylesella oralis ATCC 33269]|uniref:Phage head-tail adaptor n=1 Tax=Hoylesella oralis ATCC 33269 TaxID=873533 RepID=E7RLK3_9BACT|nr:TlpA disulfide reductase family protein [Hoylesella oralis]EFZ37634.1 putative phage head-tail adaptor [Hoylesella oralis ATCC 33269]EPH16818.1 hypothetical protein HMPREF1475_01141 [Hoylesella oralis HGA0225]SHF49798.1 Peroxiredoxin [Hoylesella oralis]
MKRIYIITLLLCVLSATGRAQKADSLVKCRYLVNGFYFEFAPFSVEYLPMRLYSNREQGLAVFVINADRPLTSDDMKYAVPPERVQNIDGIRKMLQDGKEGFPVRTMVPIDPKCPKVGDKVPRFEVKDIEGNSYTEGNTAGKPLVLNFWYTGCGPCIREMPEISKWLAAVPDARYLAVTYNKKDEIMDIVTRQGFKFKQVAADRQLNEIFKVKSFPTTVLIDKKGIIRMIMYGTNRQKRDMLLTKLREIAAEPAV